jgi:NADH:ubiquinone oxidoreductase subunit H
MAALQRRIGPNQVGYLGLLQPFSDGIKLIIKKTIIPSEANSFIFLFSPYLFFFLALLNWLIIPFNSYLFLSELEELTLLVTIAIGEFSIFGVLFSGWSANSKYPFVGSLRSTAQMISYSVSFTMILTILILINGSAQLNLFFINQLSSTFNFFILFPIAILFIISVIAESNRAPFDLPEAESELVAGFMTEHGAVSFAFFFLAEYANM